MRSSSKVKNSVNKKASLLAALALSTLICGAAFAQELSRTTRNQLMTSPQNAESIVIIQKDIVIDDATRNKTLELKVSYLQNNGKFPLIIFSHGAFGSKDAYDPLISNWVSHGYICIQPTHEDSLKKLLKDRKSDRQPQQAKEGQFAARLKEKAFSNWKSRPADVSLIIDRLAEIERQVPELKDKLDKSKIGVGGHSFGAHTSQVIGGTIIGGSDEFKDSRPKAFLLMSPQGIESGFGGSALTKDSWKNFDRPMMTITGTLDKGRNGEDYKWRLDPYKYSPEKDKYLLVVDGAHHGLGGITGISGRRFSKAGPDDPEKLAYVKSATLAYWDAYLKDSKTARRYLKSKQLEKDSHGSVSMSVK